MQLTWTDEQFSLEETTGTSCSQLCDEAKSTAQKLLNHYVKVQGLTIYQVNDLTIKVQGLTIYQVNYLTIKVQGLTIYQVNYLKSRVWPYIRWTT